MKTFFFIALITLPSCKPEEEIQDKSQLKCYSGENLIYEIVTEAFNIHKPSNLTPNSTWEIDTNLGRVSITGNCIFKSLSNL